MQIALEARNLVKRYPGVVAVNDVSFKVREGMPTAAMVTLRRDRMWHFLDRLINLASPKDDLYAKSIAMMKEEFGRAAALGVRYLVSHPGAHTGSGLEAGLERIHVRAPLRSRPAGASLAGALLAQVRLDELVDRAVGRGEEVLEVLVVHVGLPQLARVPGLVEEKPRGVLVVPVQVVPDTPLLAARGGDEFLEFCAHEIGLVGACSDDRNDGECGHACFLVDGAAYRLACAWSLPRLVVVRPDNPVAFQISVMISAYGRRDLGSAAL